MQAQAHNAPPQTQRFFRACPQHLVELDIDLRCPIGDHEPVFGDPPNERRAWYVLDAAAGKRVAVVIGGVVRWEEWYEALAARAAGRDEHGFSKTAGPRVLQVEIGALRRARALLPGTRPTMAPCLLCKHDFPVRPRGRVPNICDDCRSHGLRASMSRIA